MAVGVATGALIGVRLRTGSALVLAGLAWLAAWRSRPSREDASLVSPDLPPQESLEDFFSPSDPFIEEETEEDRWEDLRVTLAPPPSLFTPPAPAAQAPEPSSRPEPSLLQSAPVFVEVSETPILTVLDPSNGKAVLPDTITIPSTPDPPADLLSGSLMNLPPFVPTPTPLPAGAAFVVPKAGLRPPTAPLPTVAAEPKPLPPAPPPAPPARRGFLDWLRE